VSIVETANYETEIQLLQHEIAKLRQMQSEALKSAMFLGMSQAEYAEYDERHARIMSLTAKLRALQPPPPKN